MSILPRPLRLKSKIVSIVMLIKMKLILVFIVCFTLPRLCRGKIIEKHGNFNISSQFKHNWVLGGEADLNSTLNVGIYPRPGDIPVLNRKIFRGRRISILEHPYVVSIRRNTAHYLTGCIISTSVVITIAHPLINTPTNELGVVKGENYADRGTNIRMVLTVVVHECFNPMTLQCDLALLKLYRNISPKVNAKPILDLCTPEFNITNNQIAFVTGWGQCAFTGKEICLPRSSVDYPKEILDPMLRSISFPLDVMNPYCQGYATHDITLRPGMLCQGFAGSHLHKRPCLAVPGAPLVVQGKLLGVLSWGLGCGYNVDLPLVYTDMRHYSEWINVTNNILQNLDPLMTAELYEVSKAYTLNKWLNATRKVRPKIRKIDQDLDPMAIDKVLAPINGTVFDIRDFIFNANLRLKKTKMYAVIRLNLLSDFKLAEDEKKKHLQPIRIPWVTEVDDSILLRNLNISGTFQRRSH